jgi:hypothetical protein
MTLPPKALHVLVDIKKSLLAATEIKVGADANPIVEAAQLVVPSPKTTRREQKEKPPQMRKTSRGGNSVYQRACRRREWWTPVY